MLNFTYEDEIKIEINMMRAYLELNIFPQKPSAGIPIPQSRETNLLTDY
jgi:hypothetical protein